MNYVQQLFSTFREQLQANVFRTDVLRPLAWLLGLLLGSAILMISVGAPTWLLIVTSGLFGLSTATYIAAYVFCLLKDRDALRSERFAINKMATEHGVFGDNVVGIVEEV